MWATRRSQLPTPLMNPVDGIGPGANAFPYQEYLEELAKYGGDADGSGGDGDNGGGDGNGTSRSLRKLSPIERTKYRWARQGAAHAAAIRKKEFRVELTRIRASDVRDLDAESGSDPYIEFSLPQCLDAHSKRPPRDATPPMRNARHPRWTTPCTMRIPAMSVAALSLARSQCPASLWQHTARYLTPEEAAMAEKPLQIHVRAPLSPTPRRGQHTRRRHVPLS